MSKEIKQGAAFVLVLSLLVSTVSIQAMASTMEDFYGEEAAYDDETVYEYEEDAETEDEPDDELDEEDEIHEDVLDYSETSEYWYNGSKAQPDKNGFVVCDGVLIGYEGTKTKITIPSYVTKICGLFNTANRKPYFEVKIPESVQEISDSFNLDIEKITFAERNGKQLIIGTNCFNSSQISRIDLPKGTVSIGKNCFSEGIELLFVGVPSTVKKIDGWKQYEGKPCILCKKGSYAEKYAKEKKKNYSNEFAPYVDRPRKTIYATEGKWLDVGYDSRGFGNTVKLQCSDSSILKVKKHNYYVNIDNLKIYGKKLGRSTVTLSAGGYSSSFDVVVLKHTEDNVVKLILHNSMNDSMSKAQKVYHIGKCLGGYVTYDTECRLSGKYSHKYSPHTAQGALLDKKAVCDGISYAYQKILKEAGIESRLITGTLFGDSHAWTLVKIGKKWSHVDVTNGVYFQTDKQMKKHCWWNQSNYPKADYKPPKELVKWIEQSESGL